MNDARTTPPGSGASDKEVPGPGDEWKEHEVSQDLTADVDGAADPVHDAVTDREDAGDRADAPPSARPAQWLELVAAGTALVLMGALALEARRLEVRTETGGIDPRWWPELLGVTGAVLATALLVVAAVRTVDRGDLEATTRGGLLRLVATVAVTVVYLLLWPVVGFLMATSAFLLALTALFGGRGWRTLVLFPALTTAGVYLLFHTLLEVPL